MDLSRSIKWTLIDSLSKILFLLEIIIEFLLIKSTIGHCYLITCLNFTFVFNFIPPQRHLAILKFLTIRLINYNLIFEYKELKKLIINPRKGVAIHFIS